MKFSDSVLGTAVAAGMAFTAATAPPPAAADLDTGSDLGNALVDTHRDVADAIEAGVEGRSGGEDAAGAEQIAEPESTEYRDLEPGDGLLGDADVDAGMEGIR